jgi:hypothetical protein
MGNFRLDDGDIFGNGELDELNGRSGQSDGGGFGTVSTGGTGGVGTGTGGGTIFTDPFGTIDQVVFTPGQTPTPVPEITTVVRQSCERNVIYCAGGDGSNNPNECVEYRGYCSCDEVGGSPCTPPVLPNQTPIPTPTPLPLGCFEQCTSSEGVPFGVCPPSCPCSGPFGGFCVPPSVRCCGPSTGYICSAFDGTTCPEGTSGCDSLGESCAPPLKLKCSYSKEQFPCNRLQGFDGYTGTARRTSIVTDANGNALPIGCVEDPNVDTRLDTSECTPPNPPSCVYKVETAACSAVKQETGWIGTATRQVIDTARSETNCIQDRELGTAGSWDFGNCTREPFQCETIVQQSNCFTELGEGYLASQRLLRTRIVTRNNIPQPLGCNTAITSESDYDTSICTPPTGICQTETQTASCRDLLGSSYSPTQRLSQTVVRLVNGQTVPANCVTTGLRLNEYDTSVCTPVENKCTPPSATTRTVDVACTTVDSRRYSGGTAVQTQIAEYNASAPGPGECPYNWQDSGPLDTSRCVVIPPPGTCTVQNIPLSRTRTIECVQISNRFVGGQAIQRQIPNINTSVPGPGECPYVWEDTGTPDTSGCILPPPPVTTPVADQPPVVTPNVCAVPRLPASRTVSVVCSQIDTKYTRGQAIQRQVLRVDTTQPGPGECPYVWENSGPPDVSSCIIPVFWRNCVTGQLIEGNPPADFQQSEFLGVGGGTCWEPIADLGFEPNLNEALRYSYQRGSSKYPTGRDIKVTNPSYGTSYKVTITTNSNITLSNRSRTGNKGTLSFTIEPRSSEMFTVNITPQLLQELQDGLSTLSMAVEYQKVIT